jgi:hypothetical protein
MSVNRDADLGWAAGFFDGEGHVSYRRGYPNKSTGRVSGSLIAVVPQNIDNVEVLEHFKSIIGFGSIGGPYKVKTNGKINRRFEVRYGVNEVEELFKILRPNLREKKTADFNRALIQYWTHDPKPTEEDFKRTIKRNKKKGCPECSGEWDAFICKKCGYIA